MPEDRFVKFLFDFPYFGTDISQHDYILYLPEQNSIVAEHEMQLLQQATPTEIKQLYHVKSQIMARQQTFDVDSLLHLNRTSLRHEHGTLAFHHGRFPLCDFSPRNYFIHSMLLST